MPQLLTLVSQKSNSQSAQLQNKGILEGISGRSLRYFAYTGGVYDSQSIEAVKKARFEAAMAVIPRNFGSIPITNYLGQIAIHHR